MNHYIGIDFHKQFSSVAVMDEKGTMIDERKLYHDRSEELTAYFSQFGHNTNVTLEATRNWYWIVDLLQEHGMNVKLVHAKKARIIAESTIKTDKIDARVLAHLDRCDFLPQAYISDPQTRSERELLRYHINLVKIQTSVKNRIHAVLSKHNIQHNFSDLFGRAGREFLRTMHLPPVFRLELNGYLELLENIAAILQRAKKEIARHCRIWPEATLLTSAPGIGTLTGLLLAAEIADINRFANCKKLCCYSGLASSTRQSANKEFHGRIIKDSNKYIRYAVLEAVPHAIKKDPKLWRFYNKIQRTKGKNKARIATARKLLVIIYYMLKHRAPYQVAHNNNMVQVNPRSGLGAVSATPSI
ncbi:IS110 family transposase [Candidatus Omnitrophota bacterium]